MAYGSGSEHGAAAAHASSVSAPQSVAAVIDQGGFGVFQKQLLMILGLAWIADSMEVMIVSVFHQLQQRHADIGFPARLFWSASALGVGRFETRSVPADHSNVKTHESHFVLLFAALVPWPRAGL